MSNELINDAVHGLAYGDGWGFRTEFIDNYEHLQLIQQRELRGELTISDDTQMSIYLIKAIKTLADEDPKLLSNLHKDEKKRDYVRRVIADSYCEYAVDPDNNRAPGMAVMTALTYYRQLKARRDNYHVRTSELTATECCQIASKGCGANMRVSWLGLLDLDLIDVINLAIVQSEVTHGHPLALASAAMTAYAMYLIANDDYSSGGRLFEETLIMTKDLAKMTSKRRAKVGGWNGSFADGLVMLNEFLDDKIRSVNRVMQDDFDNDICYELGAGWVAEEALLNALVAFDKFKGDSFAGISKLVYSTGDSDSIAAIGGALMGGAYGVEKLNETPIYFEARYRKELAETVDSIIHINNVLSHSLG